MELKWIFRVDLSQFSNAIVPVLMVKETAEMDDATRKEVGRLFEIKSAFSVAGFSVLSIGAAILVLSLIAFAVFYYVFMIRVCSIIRFLSHSFIYLILVLCT